MRRDPPLIADGLDRRAFLRTTALVTGGLALASLPERLLADPYAPLHRGVSRRARPVRVRGRVASRGRGVAGARVTDGITVVRADADGRYELLSDAAQPWVSLSLPAGYAVPVTQHQTARLHIPLRPDARGDAAASWELAPLGRDDRAHAFLLLADTQTQDAYEMGLLHAQTVPDAIATVRALGERPVFAVACGDIMYDDLALYPEYERAMRRIGVPAFQVIGNHDLDFDARTDEGSAQTFGRHFGPSYYSFDRGAVHYVVLDDVFWHGTGYVGYLDARQLAWLAADLATVERGATVIVLAHIPHLSTRTRREGSGAPDASESVNNREALYRLLEPFRAHILSGHTHEHEHVFEGGVHEHVHGTVCGAWWSGPICWDGTPNGYGVYEVRDEELRWRYKGTGLDGATRMRLYPRGADAAAPDETVANVWEWDPEWRVAWYEDGERRGEMMRRPGLDPLAVRLHTGPDLPPRRTWVEPMHTDHLFRARPSPGAREVRVEATDRWGAVHTETLRLG